MKSLILSGGGSFGCFEAGVLYEIFDKIKFDKIFGTSVGALNAILLGQCYVDNSKDVIKKLWTEDIKKNKNVYRKNYLKIVIDSPPYNFSPLRKIIKNTIDFKSIMTLPQKISMISTDLVSGETISISTKDPCINENTLLEAAIASASIPPVFPPVHIDNYKLVDGGVRENIPVKEVVEKRQSDFVLVVLCHRSGIKIKDKKFNGLISVATRSISMLMDEVQRNDLDMMLRINDMVKLIKDNEKTEWLKSKKFIDVNIIQPPEDLPGETLVFKQSNLSLGFEMGRQKAKELIKSINI
jgi:predicted acylesterase/phospholipase RssA